MRERDRFLAYLRSIATNAVEAQSETDLDALMDRLGDIESDLAGATRILEQQPNPREKGDDDGVEYADPRDRRNGRE